MNKLKTIARILLPLLILGISWCIDWLYDFIVYGGFEQMYKTGLIDDSSTRATHMFMGIFYFFILPVMFLIHWVFCSLNNKYDFINMKLAIIVSVFLTICLCMLSWSNDTNQNLENMIGIVCTIALPTLLYFYGLNITKRKSIEPGESVII
jgi:hypothetical protein